MKLALASIFTLGLLFAFLLAVIAGIFYFLGIVEIWFLITFTGVLFFLQWLLSPYLSDLVFQWLYKLKWIGIEGIAKRDKGLARFIEETCKKNRIKVPKIGFINDDNPQAFCYGSAAFNARLVFTEGIFTYLDKEERKAVFAHELGHIVHRDFIIMSLAAFLLSLLYHFSQVLLRARGRKKGGIVILGIISYVFYWIGTYILLFLSRIREYFADEFSAKATSPDSLARALIKVAYGIIAKPEAKSQLELMKGTRTLGIMDFSAAKGIGLAYITSLKLKSWKPLQKIFLFDLKNPWAFVYELNSSHPLTAKRIRRLSKLGKVSAFDFEAIEKYPVDLKKLYANFFRDIFFLFLPLLFFLGFSISAILLFLKLVVLPIPLSFIVCLFFVGLGLSVMAKTLYRYPEKSLKETTIFELMEDVYASPIRGKWVKLKGKIIGRGIPGLILSEDMMFQDRTGLVYLNYEGLIPFFGNLVFALFKLDKLVGKEAEIEGWFLRGLSHRIELKEVRCEGKRIKSWVKLWGMLAGLMLILIGFVLLIIFGISF